MVLVFSNIPNHLKVSTNGRFLRLSLLLCLRVPYRSCTGELVMVTRTLVLVKRVRNRNSVNSCPHFAIHCVYSFLTLSLNSLLTDTSRGCTTDVNLPGMAARSVFISVRILFLSSPKCPRKLLHTSRDGRRSNAPGRRPQNVRTQSHAIAASTQPLPSSF
jgi:hypothetical protein